MIRHVINFFIVAGLLWGFNQLEWIVFLSEKQTLFNYSILVLALWAASTILSLLFIALLVVLLAMRAWILILLAAVLYVVTIGWFSLQALAAVTGWIEVPVSFFFTGLIMSLLLAFVRIPSEKKERRSSSFTFSSSSTSGLFDRHYRYQVKKKRSRQLPRNTVPKDMETSQPIWSKNPASKPTVVEHQPDEEENIVYPSWVHDALDEGNSEKGPSPDWLDWDRSEYSSDTES